MTLSNLHFFHLGMDLMGVSHKKTNKNNNPRLFITYFGTTPDVCLVVWNILKKTGTNIQTTQDLYTFYGLLDS